MIIPSIAIADALLPGSGLIVEGRLAVGALLLLPAIVVLAALAVALVVGGALAADVWPQALPSYVLLGAIALLMRWRYTRLARIDPVRARELARAAAKAWLRGQDAEAIASAKQLVRAAPELPNAWRMLALVSNDPKAERQAQSIEARR